MIVPKIKTISERCSIYTLFLGKLLFNTHNNDLCFSLHATACYSNGLTCQIIVHYSMYIDCLHLFHNISAWMSFSVQPTRKSATILCTLHVNVHVHVHVHNSSKLTTCICRKPLRKCGNNTHCICTYVIHVIYTVEQLHRHILYVCTLKCTLKKV